MISGFSVIMPTYNQAGFIRNAIGSLFAQTYTEWELIIVNDGCTDNTEEFISDYLDNPKVQYIKNSRNEGLGYSINRGLDVAKYDHIAYLPSDDFYYADHLQVLAKAFDSGNDPVLVYARTDTEVADTFTFNNLPDAVNGISELRSIQLVQTAHKKEEDRWVERSEFDTENLFDLFFRKLVDKGCFQFIDRITSKWTIHPRQRHKIISERFGGNLNLYRQYYNVRTPIKLKISDKKFLNEHKQYKSLSEKPVIPTGRKLKILLVGELSSNGERICALSERGHELFGLWVQEPSYSFFTVGHLPYGNVKDIPYTNWRDEVERVKPDVIYALQSFGAVQIAHEVLSADLGIPFVWHIKEGPSACMQKGLWEKLIDLLYLSDGNIFINDEAKLYYEQFIPHSGSRFIMDGDLPKADYFTDDFSPKLSAQDGVTHTVVSGRIKGLVVDDITYLAKQDIHLHLYTESYHASKVPFNRQAIKAAPNHFHIHDHCPAQNWVKEFSKYDAGWLHCFDSRNGGDVRKIGWDDLNLPARMNTLAAAGVPMIQKDNSGHIVAMQRKAQQHDIGIFYNTLEDLVPQLQDRIRLAELSENAKRERMAFTFDHYVPELVEFFEQVISNSKCKRKK